MGCGLFRDSIDWGESAEPPAVLDGTFDNVPHGFSDHDPVAGNERNDGVGLLLDRLDEVAIEHERLPVESCDIDHGRLSTVTPY